MSYLFGHDVLKSFMDHFGFDLVVRAHQVVEDGYEFAANRALVTIFSAPNYCGSFDNAAACLSIGEGLVCSFHVIPASLRSKKEERTRRIKTWD